jgi:hypothetical protein
VIPRNLKSKAKLQIFAGKASPSPSLPPSNFIRYRRRQQQQQQQDHFDRTSTIGLTATIAAFITRQHRRPSRALGSRSAPSTRARCGDSSRDRIFIGIWEGAENPHCYLDSFPDFFLLDHRRRAPSS